MNQVIVDLKSVFLDETVAKKVLFLRCYVCTTY